MRYAYAYQKDSRELVIGTIEDVHTHIDHQEIIHPISEQDLIPLVTTCQKQEMIVTNLSDIAIEPSGTKN